MIRMLQCDWPLREHAFPSRSAHIPPDFRDCPTLFISPTTSSKEQAKSRWTRYPRTCGTCEFQPLPLVDLSSSNLHSDLNRYLALCGFSTRNLSRGLTLILTSVVSSTRSLRLLPDISSGGGPLLVAAANTAVGHLHIHRQPLRRHLGPSPYHLLLLFRSFSKLDGGPSRLKVLPVAQIPPGARSGDPDGRWRYRIYSFSVRGPDNVLTAILLTRVYALWERNRAILWSLLAYYVGFAGFAGVHYSLRFVANIPISIHRFSVGDYPRDVSGLSLGPTNFTGMHQFSIEG